MGGRSLEQATRERAQLHGDGELGRQGFYGWWLSRHESRVEEEEEAWNREEEREKEEENGEENGETQTREKRERIFPSLSPSQPAGRAATRTSV